MSTTATQNIGTCNWSALDFKLFSCWQTLKIIYATLSTAEIVQVLPHAVAERIYSFRNRSAINSNKVERMSIILQNVTYRKTKCYEIESGTRFRMNPNAILKM